MSLHLAGLIRLTEQATVHGRSAPMAFDFEVNKKSAMPRESPPLTAQERTAHTLGQSIYGFGHFWPHACL
eukprot:CAMPEP_0195100962 /NCGR_PEP_ID=MMETSP0448-20130528/64833_1 /TAXON_ID=66468 /ORGANISM="Heterocapsa triquestra, Strain CCMP 448" /LENGTH=69 /DNA_ID=CAMNT_0040136199 /DNA_START=188 /DNA_END=394 /DNA_ORIENTATION=-